MPDLSHSLSLHKGQLQAMGSPSQLQARFPASSAQPVVCRQEDQRPGMLRATCIPVPAQHAAAVPWAWQSSVDPCKIMAKAAEQWQWKQLSQTMGTLWHSGLLIPARVSGERPLVFTEKTFHWVNGTKTGIWWKDQNLKHGAACPAILVQRQPSRSMRRHAVMVTTPCTHGCSPGGGYPASSLHKVQRKRGLDEGSMCGFFLHLFTMLMPSCSYMAWLGRSSICTWRLHWRTGRFCLWSQWHHEVGSCAMCLRSLERWAGKSFVFFMGEDT